MAKKPEHPAKTVDYRKRADECASWAKRAVNDQAREAFAKMEGFWRQRAKNTANGSAAAGTIVDKGMNTGADAPLVPDQPVKREREPTR